MDEILSLLDHADVRAVARARVVVTAWRHAPRVDVIRLLEESVKPLHERWPDGTALVVVPSREQPDLEARKALQAFLERQAGHVVGATALLEMTGIKGAMLRTAAKGVIAAMRMPFAIRMSGTRAEASAQAVELLRAARVEAPTTAVVGALLTDAMGPG